VKTSFTGSFEINQAAGIIKLVFAGFGEGSGYNLVDASLRLRSGQACVKRKDQ
jgi:hypothetical protein